MATGVTRLSDSYGRLPSKQWKTSICFFALSFLFLLITMNRDVNVYDEALILEGTLRVMSGAVPHRDFYTNYGPGQFYVLGTLFKLLGPSVLVERLWDTVVRAGISTAALIVVLRLSTPWQGLFAGGLTLVWLARVQNYAFPLFPSLLFALVGCLFILYFLEKRRPLLLILAGASAGLTTLFRYDVGFYTVLALSILLVVSSISHRCSLLEIVRTIAILALGVLLVCAPLAIVYALDGNAADFYLDIIDFPAHTYPKMRSLPFPDAAALLRSKDLASIYLPPVIWASAIVFALMDRRRTDPQPPYRRWGILLLTLLSALFYLKGLVRVSVVHLMASIVPAIMLTALMVPPARSTSTKALSGLSYVLLAVVALVTVTALPYPLSAARSNLQWTASGGMWKTNEAAYDVDSCRPRQEFMRLACFKIEADRGKAIDYILHNSTSSDTIFEGLNNYDKLILNDMLIYFATNRTPASKWYHFDPGLQTSQPVQDKIIAELTTTKPRFIVVDSTWDAISEPNASSVSSGVNVLGQFIASNYATVQRFGTITLLSPADGTASQPSSTNGQ